MGEGIKKRLPGSLRKAGDAIFNTISGEGRTTRLKSFLLNLTGCRLHTILELGDRDFREALKHAGRRDMFFSGMQAAPRYVLHET